MKIAAVLTCFNRKEKTLNCIKKLMNQRRDIDIYVCDDGSTDLTSEAIQELYPEVKIIKSTGGLFWSKGMFQAMKAAVVNNYDFYLMVNDDVDFYDSMLDIMLNSYKISSENCAIVGSTQSVISKDLTYGGSVLKTKWNINKKMLLKPNGEIQKCDFANWNCFLIDNFTVDHVGLIDNKYEHGIGDFDYSCQMKKKEIPIYIATDYVGICERNPIKNTFQDHTLSINKRLSLLLSAKGLPIKSYMRFYWKNYKLIGVPFCSWMYLKMIMLIFLKQKS
ncbi:glycosyltransferase family 2 protein [Priestia koreensis]|uniref:Glycosyltransferase 2-like domain-containing protein n=1 Tax=Priestia koreensis TaxID=284581 RepID=A0A0M0LHN5_9BACI|nr:glycosyltransferase [Priestia koreensis]KOO50427.1 hypothetical protein AMD01_01330 [Priestia koreensis]